MKVLALHLTPFLSYASAQGANVNQILDEIGFQEVIDEPNCLIDVAEFYGILKVIKSSLTIDKPGLRAGNFCKLSSLGVVYQISLQCITMKEALYYLKDFISETFPSMTLEIKQTDSTTSIVLDLDDKTFGIKDMVLECYQTIIAREIKLMSVHPVDIQVYVPSNNPTSYIDRYVLTFPAVELKETINNYSRLHFDYLIPKYLGLISEIKEEQHLVGRVKSTLLQMATPELPGLKEVADIFCTTPRTLQRALAKEGVTFREILNELKKQISLLLLKHEPYLVKDISYLLGYSETAAFARAFHNWYGQTPSEYIQTETT